MADLMMPDYLGAFNQGMDRGRQRGLSSLMGQAFNAPADQRQNVLAKLAGVDGAAAMQTQQALSQADDDVHVQLAKRAKMVVQLAKSGQQQMAQQAYAAMLPVAQRGGFNGAPAQLSPDLIPGLEQLASAMDAQEAPGVNSTYLDDQGNRVAVLSDASTKVLGKSAPAAGSTISPYQQAQLDLSRQRLELSRQNSGGGGGITPYQQAQLDLSQQRLELAKEKETSGGGQSPMPVGALKMLAESEEALSITSTLDSTLSKFEQQLSKGELDLGPIQNKISQGRNFVGQSDANSRNYGSFMAALEKIRNDSLRLNKGVQTEGDAQRAWNELAANINDGPFVLQRLQEIRALNRQATQLHQRKMGMVKDNYKRGQAPEVRGAADLSDEELLRELGL